MRNLPYLAQTGSEIMDTSNDPLPQGAALSLAGANSVALELDSTPTTANRVNILGVGVTPLDIGKALTMLDQWRQERRRDYVCLVCVHGLVTAQRDSVIRNALNACGYAAQDGMPLVWWSRAVGYSQARRVCGTDLLDAVCGYGVQRNYRHYFYGSSPGVLDKLVKRLQERHPGMIVCGYKSPAFRPLTPEEDEEDVRAINETRPDFVWVGLGMPKQEQWMAEHLGRVEATALLGVGAAFDFHAGVKPRAPVWMQRTGLEWMFRLMSEPRRLAHRYIIDNLTFLALATQQIAGLKSFSRRT